MRTDEHYKICIDIAHGHMEWLLSVCKRIKSLDNANITLMAGNIANPETYIDYEEAGVDYIRVGVGGGSACLTASNTGVYYPYFSLMKEVYELRKKYGGKAKIIADGNIKGYRDIQKAFIYADYVMIGGLFNKAIESAGKTTYGKRYWNINGNKIFRPLATLLTYGREIPRRKFKWAMNKVKEGKLVVWKQYRGMSTKEAQKNIDENARLKTSEGKVFYQKVEYDLAGWVENESDYLRSSMSYTNSRNLDEHKESRWVVEMSVAYNQ
jgi:IMP dehydrogenase/GMP reductase